MPSFDVVSKIDQHEVDNARNQASKEIAQRYDFKGTDSTIEQTEEGIVIRVEQRRSTSTPRGTCWKARWSAGRYP